MAYLRDCRPVTAGVISWAVLQLWAEGGAVVGPIVPAATSADLRAGVEVRGLALGLGLHGQPYTMLPRGRARSAR